MLSMKKYIIYIILTAWASISTAQTASTVVYKYDEFNRLTEADYGTGKKITYTYDKLGNRKSQISTNLTVSLALKVSAKAFLQGSYSTTTTSTATAGLMNDDLRRNNLIPTTEPYTGLEAFTHVSGGGEVVPPSALSITGDNALVDWVFMELRNKDNPLIVVATRSALIQRDGDIVDVDGVSPVNFNISADYFYVTIRHRNHLGIMTESPVDLRNSLIFLNFTDGTTRPYGTNAMKDFGNGKLGLWAGNIINDGVLKYSGSGNDRFPILSRIGGTNVLNTVSGYFREDTNLDGIVKYSGSGNDRLIILQNIGNTNVLLTLTEQIPK